MSYKRVMLKLSGEALAGELGHGINDARVKEFASMIKQVHDIGVELSIVVGGGNFWRGRTNPQMDRVTADQIGMLATTMNAMALADSVKQLGVPCKVMNALDIPRVVESFVKDKADQYLSEKTVVIFGGGTGNPYFSTDSAAALRAVEIGAEIVLKATLVDGVYDKDPHQFPDAVKFDEITLDEVISRDLKVMDSTAAAISRDNKIPMLVFDIADTDNLIRILSGEKIGTLVRP